MFDLDKNIEITKKEYDFFNNNIDKKIFDLFFFKGINKKNIKEIKEIKDVILINEKQDYVYFSQPLSIENKESLLLYFYKDWQLEKFNNNNEYWKNVKEQIEKLNNTIKPVLNSLGIEYNLYLTGGFVRDYILNKENSIKDLDILIEFNDKFQKEKINGRNSSEKTEKQKELIDAFLDLNKTILKNLNIDMKNLSREKLLHEIVLKTIEQEYKKENTEFFFTDPEKKDKTEIENKTDFDNIESDYSGLFSVIKIKNSGKYPLDLLLNGNKFSYLNNFDFDICKCTYSINDFNNLNANTASITENLYLYEGFVFDAIYKKLSLNPNIFYNEEQVDKCLTNHYLRIKDKYNYEVIVKDSKNDEKIINYINKAVKFHEYKYKFKSPETKVKAKKI